MKTLKYIVAMTVLASTMAAQAVVYKCKALTVNGAIWMDAPFYNIVQTGSSLVLKQMTAYPSRSEFSYPMRGTMQSNLKWIYTDSASNPNSGMTIVFERTSVDSPFTIRMYFTSNKQVSTTCE